METVETVETGGVDDTDTGQGQGQETEEDDGDVVRGAKRVLRSEEDTSSDDEGNTCTICLERWTSSGSHRICSLACGHLFGYTCIARWLKEHRQCPQCKRRASKTEIRKLFVPKLSVVDNTEKVRALRELELERKRRKDEEKEKARMAMELELVKEDFAKLRRELQRREGLDGKGTSSQGSRYPCTGDAGAGYQLVASVPMRGSRVFDIDISSGIVIASQTELIASGASSHGLVKMFLYDSRRQRCLPTHGGAIRDVKCSPQRRGDRLVLSASVDRTLRISSTHTDSAVMSYSLGYPSWACEWDVTDPNLIYCGMTNGTVLTFDIRKTDEFLSRVQGIATPVSALCNIPPNPQFNFAGGVLVGCMGGVWLLSRGSERVWPLPLSGLCTSVGYDAPSGRCLASFRKSSTCVGSSHVVFDVTGANSITVVTTLAGHVSQKVLSKSLAFTSSSASFRDPCLSVASGDEATDEVWVWDVATSSVSYRLQAHPTTVMDVRHACDGEEDFLGTLSEGRLDLFRLAASHSVDV